MFRQHYLTFQHCAIIAPNFAMTLINIMQTGPFKTLSIRLLSVLYTAEMCCQAIVRSYTGKISRSWINNSLQTWSQRLFSLICLKPRVFNPNNVRLTADKPHIIMCNHTSLYDIPISFYAFPGESVRMLAKKELSRIPMMGKSMKKTDFPFIDRNNRDQAIKDLEQAKKIMQTGVSLWLAPEGTRSKNGQLKPFKKGGFITAIETGATIIPIGIRNAHQILGSHRFKINTGVNVEVHIGEPIDASGYTLMDKDTLLNDVRQSISKLSGAHS